MKTVKTYQIDSNPNAIGFVNIERKPESEIFNDVLEILKTDKDILIGEKISGALEDYCTCDYSGEKITVINDVDYGTMLYTQNAQTKNKLIRLLEGV